MPIVFPGILTNIKNVIRRELTYIKDFSFWFLTFLKNIRKFFSLVVFILSDNAADNPAPKIYDVFTHHDSIGNVLQVRYRGIYYIQTLLYSVSLSGSQCSLYCPVLMEAITPPSISRSVPVMKPACSPRRNAPAYASTSLFSFLSKIMFYSSVFLHMVLFSEAVFS